MPARQPFTALCQAASRPRGSGRTDLHLHTTCSDGSYTPAEVVDVARRSGLAAIAITDHDTLAGIPEAREAAAGSGLEIIPGVEISAEHEGREFHLLGYFVQLDDEALNATLQRLGAHRVERFWTMVERLKGCGVSLDEGELHAQAATGVLSRRHLAMLLIKARKAGSIREAFTRYLGDRGRVVVPKVRLPVVEAMALVRGAGGVASWAHPSYDCTRESLSQLRDLGLHGVEAEYPGFRASRIRELRQWAAELGMSITGGSDCHGPDHPSRAIGACSITADELANLRGKSLTSLASRRA